MCMVFFPETMKEVYPGLEDYLFSCNDGDCVNPVVGLVSLHPDPQTVVFYRRLAISFISHDRVRSHLRSGCTVCWNIYEFGMQLD